MLGVGVNSNAGLIGNITLDEQNFDWRRWPTSWEDIRNATAWRGGGQQFRIQASPGTVYQQYLVNFHNPYLFDTPISFGLSGSYFTRIYQDWTEKRLGARVSLGYQFLFDPNLSTVVSFQGENVNISNPTIPTPPPLEARIGQQLVYSSVSGKSSTTPATARSCPRKGTASNLSLEQAFGSFTFPASDDRCLAAFLVARAAGYLGQAYLDFEQSRPASPAPIRRSTRTFLPVVTRLCEASTSVVLRRWTRTSRSAVTSNSSTRWSTCSPSPATTCSAAWHSATSARSSQTSK